MNTMAEKLENKTILLSWIETVVPVIRDKNSMPGDSAKRILNELKYSDNKSAKAIYKFFERIGELPDKKINQLIETYEEILHG